jgi:hypothetical protein
MSALEVKADITVDGQNVHFGSKADVPQKVVSALPPKADMCGAATDVR